MTNWKLMLTASAAVLMLSAPALAMPAAPHDAFAKDYVVLAADDSAPGDTETGADEGMTPDDMQEADQPPATGNESGDDDVMPPPEDEEEAAPSGDEEEAAPSGDEEKAAPSGDNDNPDE